MSYLDTLLVNNHDVRTITGVRVVDQIYHWAPDERRGGDDVIPGRDGEIGARLARAKFIIRVPVQITGADRGTRNNNLRAAVALINGGVNGLVSLRRRIAKDATTGYDEHTASGRFLSANALTLFNPRTARTEFQFYNLNGAWWTGSVWTTP